MTNPFDSENRTGDIDNTDNAGNADAHPRDERTLDDGRVVKTEPVPVTNQHSERNEQRDLGVKDVHADGQGCTCDNDGEGCTCGHHQNCDCPPGECHCQGHADAHGEQGAHRSEGGVPDHGDCECQQCQERRRENREGNGDTRDNGEEKDFTHPDTVNEDGTNPAVRTVDKAEGYNENASWNDGIEPAERQEPQAYENEDKNVN